jgi:hypothetical protein
MPTSSAVVRSVRPLENLVSIIVMLLVRGCCTERKKPRGLDKVGAAFPGDEVAMRANAGRDPDLS